MSVPSLFETGMASHRLQRRGATKQLHDSHLCVSRLYMKVDNHLHASIRDAGDWPQSLEQVFMFCEVVASSGCIPFRSRWHFGLATLSAPSSSRMVGGHSGVDRFGAAAILPSCKSPRPQIDRCPNVPLRHGGARLRDHGRVRRAPDRRLGARGAARGAQPFQRLTPRRRPVLDPANPGAWTRGRENHRSMGAQTACRRTHIWLALGSW